MRKFLLLFLLSLPAFGQYYPPTAITAQNPSNQQVYVALDSSNNLDANMTGSGSAAVTVSGYIPPVSITGQNPSGAQVYLKTDSNGNLYVNCQVGCSGGGGGAFSAITSATNTTAAMVVGSGASLTVTGTGTIGATGVTTPTTVTPLVPSYVAKSCSNYVTSGTSVTCTWSVAPAAGEYVLMGVWANGTSTVFTLTDSASNTYTAATPVHTTTTLGTTTNSQLIYFGPLTAPITTSTLSESGDSGAYIEMQGETALNLSASTDGSPCYADTTGTTAVTCGTSITTTVANDFIFCSAVTQTGGDTFSAGSGFTLGGILNVNNVTQYKIQSSTGALTPSITGSTTAGATMSCAAFKPGSSSASSSMSGNNVSVGSLTNGNCVQASSLGLLISEPCGSVISFPGTPNIVYSFVAPGDQIGTTVHDLSGNGNNATISRVTDGATNYWTGTGVTFQGQSANTYMLVGSATTNITNRSFCATVYLAAPPSPNITSINTVYLVGDSIDPGWIATAAFVYGSGVYQDVSNLGNGGGSLNQANIPSETGLHTKCWVMGNSGAADKFYTDGVLQSMQGSNGSSGGFGSSAWVIGSMISGDVNMPTWYYLASWAAQLTAAQVQQASIAMTQAVAARGIPISPPNTATDAPVIHTSGDSITCCAGASTTEWYPTLLSVNAGYGSVLNEGQPGFAAWTFMEEVRWRDTPVCNTGNQPSLLTIFGGTNDGYFGATAAKTFAAIQGFATIAKAAGCQVGVATMISRTALDSFKDSLNPLIRAGAANGGYFLIDTASSANLGCDGCYSNSTYFNTDNVHPKNPGQVILAAEFSNAINAYGIGAATSANPTAYTNTATILSADRYVTGVPTTGTTYTMPDCLGVTGANYQIINASAGANTITFSGLSGEAITGSTTLAQNLVAIFQAQLISQSAGGCGWQRIQ